MDLPAAWEEAFHREAECPPEPADSVHERRLARTLKEKQRA
jgi:hypothetical protein